MSELQLTIDSVTKPGDFSFGDGALAVAMERRRDHAVKAYADVAEYVLNLTNSQRTSLAQRRANLENALVELQKQEAALDKAIKHAETKGGSILPLAAELGAKDRVVNFMVTCNMVVPQGNDPVWNVPSSN